MKEILDSAKVIVCVGTGGVGKTTIAAGLAALLARRGQRVLVLTVDPSRRLKQTLGLAESGVVTRVDLPDLKGGKGELWGVVMNPQKTFDDFVLRGAGNSEKAKKLLSNKLYQQLSTTLAGSQEFTALENLLDADQDGRYDVIVLDTPPAQHAQEFLQAPQKLAAIFNEGIAKWFRGPSGKAGFLSGLMQAGTKQALKILESLTGAEFMGQLAEFFSYIHAWQERLEARAIEAHRVLVRPDTHFLLITAFDESKFIEGENFAREIRKGGYRLSAMIVNRAHPLWVRENLTPLSPPWSTWREEWARYFEQRRTKVSQLKDRVRGSFVVLEVPEQKKDISNPSEVAAFATELNRYVEGES